jgi:hypothetical protein
MVQLTWCFGSVEVVLRPYLGLHLQICQALACLYFLTTFALNVHDIYMGY